MLVMSRRIGQKILIGAGTENQIEICLVDIRDGKARIGVTAPKEIAVHREEIQALIDKTEQGKMRP